MKYLRLFEYNKNEDRYDMYSGITQEAWDTIWRDNNLKDKETK